jgi:hypothetical protein
MILRVRLRLHGCEAASLEHFSTKWLPGSSKKMRQSKGLERFSDSVGTETALD